MVGKPPRAVIKRLAREGVQAPATLLARRPRLWLFVTGWSGRERVLKTRARIEPPGAEPFEIDRWLRFQVLEVPRVGDVFGVLCDPEDHDAVMVDFRVPIRRASA